MAPLTPNAPISPNPRRACRRLNRPILVTWSLRSLPGFIGRFSSHKACSVILKPFRSRRPPNVTKKSTKPCGKNPAFRAFWSTHSPSAKAARHDALDEGALGEEEQHHHGQDHQRRGGHEISPLRRVFAEKAVEPKRQGVHRLVVEVDQGRQKIVPVERHAENRHARQCRLGKRQNYLN